MKRQTSPIPPAPLSSGRFSARSAGLLLLFIVVGLVIYWPALTGGMIWDDDGHITSPRMRDWHGLWLTWTNIRETQQYYPLLHTVFWIQAQIWPPLLGEGNFTGYHVVNVLMHAVNCVLVWRVVRRIVADHPDLDRSTENFWTSCHDKAGLLAAMVYLLHPVMVESVAWITELKNSLSGFFYLLAILFYLRFDERRQSDPAHLQGRLYTASLGIFILALLSKTVTASLPGALLVIFWWRRGRLTPRDVLPLIPFILLGGAMGLLTAWVEKTIIGAEGSEFDYNLTERFLIAGHVIWFYLGKLLWPAKLIFMYEKWEIDTKDIRQWMRLIGIAVFMLSLLALAWFKGRAPNSKLFRAPLAVMLFFGGTLLPVLGFFNVYPFRYSFVADHFQYLACLSVIAALCALAGRLPNRAFAVLALVLAAALGWRSHVQARDYRDSDTLYLRTLEKNPKCWMAQNNYATELLNRAGLMDRIGRRDLAEQIRGEAEHRLNLAVAMNPTYVEAIGNLGKIASARGDLKSAIALYRRTLEINPKYQNSYYNLGTLMGDTNQHQEAVRLLTEAVAINKYDAMAYNNLGNSLMNLQRYSEAIYNLKKALELEPRYAIAHNNLAGVYQKQDRWDLAIQELQKALRIEPDNAFLKANLKKAQESWESIKSRRP